MKDNQMYYDTNYIDTFLYTFRINRTGHKTVHEYEASHFFAINGDKEKVDPIITKTIEYQQFEMPINRFYHLVETFYLNRKENEQLRSQIEGIEKEERLRKNFPSLQKAYEQYQIILNMVKYQQ